MALTSEEYNRLLSISLKLRIAESALVDILEEFKDANKTLRELLLKGD